jgi:hypothetical protein
MGLDRLDVTWGVLIGLAVATVLVPTLLTRALLANGVVLAFAAVKGRRIVLDYLDLRSAPALWRGLVTTWLLIVVLFAWLAAAATALI